MYNQVLLKSLEAGDPQWYSTKIDLPGLTQLVAVRLNADWFNEYLVLEENEG